ncbi:MAG TPA: hypothetical protein VM051_08220 [Usitatibacter sp.]|nr:hypothetical protein [Usitatibacter sp.]
MNGLVIFCAEVATSLAVSALILRHLQALLRDLGRESCEQGPRGATEFWVAYTQLMMLVAPVLLVSLFSSASHYADPAQQLKNSLALVLSGQFAGLVLVGRAVWKSLVKEPLATEYVSGVDPRTVNA